MRFLKGTLQLIDDAASTEFEEGQQFFARAFLLVVLAPIVVLPMLFPALVNSWVFAVAAAFLVLSSLGFWVWRGAVVRRANRIEQKNHG